MGLFNLTGKKESSASPALKPEIKEARERFYDTKRRWDACIREGKIIQDIAVNFGFPDDWDLLNEQLRTGEIYWRNFVSGINEKGHYVGSVQCQMRPGSMIKEHYHSNAKEVLYVVTGKLIEEISGKELCPYQEIPYIIQPNIPHRLLAVEDTNVVMKMISL